jgi:hypothetical protein
MNDLPTIKELVDGYREGAGDDFDEHFATMLAEATLSLIRKGQVYYDRENGTLETIVKQ